MARVMKPHYELDQETKDTILELVATCSRLDLGNATFSYYRDHVDFHLREYVNNWGVIVWQGSRRDVYEVVDEVIAYQYSE